MLLNGLLKHNSAACASAFNHLNSLICISSLYCENTV